MKYKVGDKVRIKSLDWYNENKDVYGNVEISEDYYFKPPMSEFCGKVVVIKYISNKFKYYDIEEDDGADYWTDEMIECKMEEEYMLKEEKQEMLLGLVSVKDKGQELIPHKDYEIKQDGEKFYLVKKKPKYPQTYEECCGYFGNLAIISSGGYKNELLTNFYKLLICRDAYWKIAGEEMGLGKPWEPDYKKVRYGICRYIDDIVKIYRSPDLVEHHILEFPTEEMRDAFKDSEEISKLIEKCKDFL